MKTLVLGATPNPDRFAYKAVKLLRKYGHEVVPVGIKKGEIDGLEIINGKPEQENIHTVTLYIGSDKQKDYEDYILALHPKRIIFNPGTENINFIKKAEEKGIETHTDCTLVMLNSGYF